MEVDIDSHFELGDQDIASFRHNSFVKLPGVFNEATLAHYGPDMSLMVKEADKTPLQKDPDYAQAFTQVVVSVKNYAVWCSDQCGKV